MTLFKYKSDPPRYEGIESETWRRMVREIYLGEGRGYFWDDFWRAKWILMRIREVIQEGVRKSVHEMEMEVKARESAGLLLIGKVATMARLDVGKVRFAPCLDWAQWEASHFVDKHAAHVHTKFLTQDRK